MASKENLAAIALEGKPPEVRAKVLEISLKAGIDEQEPLWWIFIALGYLESTALESPKKIQVEARRIETALSTVQKSTEQTKKTWEQINSQAQKIIQTQRKLADDLDKTTEKISGIDPVAKAVSKQNLIVLVVVATCSIASSSGFYFLGRENGRDWVEGAAIRRILENFDTLQSLDEWGDIRARCIREKAENPDQPFLLQ